MSNYSVYVHTNRANGKKYVGITSLPPESRWRDGFGYYKNKYFYAAIQKSGWDNFNHEVVANDLTFEQAAQLEIELIAKYKSHMREFGYNLSTGGELPAKGHHCSFTEETRLKMSKAKKGKAKSPETRKHMSEGQKARMDHRRGKGADSGNAHLIYQRTKDGELVRAFYGRGEVVRALGIASPSKITAVCRGERKSAYGYLWEYAKE